jgi:hypothetical protein
MRYRAPVTAEKHSNLRPHFKLRRYCFGGAAFPRDWGEGGAKAWNRSVFMKRLADLKDTALFRKAIEDVFEERDRVPWLMTRETVCEGKEKKKSLG